jgi:photosystem II stability/assembly factor-like uncharacterized protein
MTGARSVVLRRSELLALLLSPVVTAAEPNEWSSTGLQGGPVRGIEFATSTPGVALLAAGHAIYRTTDGGATWTEVHRPGLSSSVTFARDPAGPSRLIVAGSGVQPLLTDDGGQTFTPVSRFVVPNTGAYESTVAIAADGVWYGGTSLGTVFRSTDQGETWVARSSGLTSSTSRQVERLVIDPRNSERVYALLADVGNNLYSTANGGLSWSLHAGVCDKGCVDIALSPQMPDQLLVASGTGLFASGDAGQTWVQRDARVFSTVRFDALVPGRVLAVAANNSLTRSDDGGQTWDFTAPLPVGSNAYLTAAFAFDPLQPGRVLLGTSQGAFLTEDAGTTWLERNSGINGVNVGHVISLPAGFAPAGTFAVDASVRPGLLVYDPAPQRWSHLGGGSLQALAPDVHIVSLARGAAPPSFYAGSIRGLFRSDDGGANWVKAPSLASASIGSVAASASDPQSVYVVANGEVLFSDDGGLTFDSRSSGLPSSGVAQLLIDRYDQNRLVAYSGDALGIFRTSNGGVSWHQTPSGPGSNELWRLAADPEEFSTLYAATSDGLWKSIDAGDSWAVLPGDHFVGHVAVDAYDPAHIVRASYQLAGHGFERSVDGGETWELIPRSSPGLSRGVAFDYTTPGGLMTIVDAGGIETLQLALDVEVTSATPALPVHAPADVEIVVHNRGPYAASQLVLTAAVPRTGTRAQPSRGECEVPGASSFVRCDLGALRAGESILVTFDTPEFFSGDDPVRFELNGREPDPDLGNNQLTLVVERRSDLAVTLSSSAATIAPDGTVTLVLIVSNGDFSPAEDVRFNVQLPAPLQFVSVPSGLSCVESGPSPASALSCVVGALSRHSSAEFRMTVTARQVGIALVTASVTSQGTDPVPGNNSSSATISVVVPPAASSGGDGGGGAIAWPLVLSLAGFAAHRRRSA